MEDAQDEKKRKKQSSENTEEAKGNEVEVIASAEAVQPRPIQQIRVIKEKAAMIIAITLVVGYLVLMILSFVYINSTKGTVADLEELMKTISAVLLGTIGSILGYYFGRTSREAYE